MTGKETTRMIIKLAKEQPDCKDCKREHFYPCKEQTLIYVKIEGGEVAVCPGFIPKQAD